MKKDKKWLVDKWTKERSETDVHDPMYQFLSEVIADVVNQLEEPETLYVDKEQLVKKIENYIPLHDKTVGDVVDGILEIVEQLPEMEVFSPEWLEKNEQSIDYRSTVTGQFAESNKLRNTIVPKQELPTIPQFVSDWIEETKKQRKSYIYAIAQIYDKYETDESLSEEENRIFQWMEAYDNDEVFARAWLDGYKIKKEPKYIVRFNRGTYKPVFIALDKISNHIHFVESHDYNKEDLRVHLNEWEIRALDDGDVLFEHFAVKAEE